ncbi:glycoside hydrolase family 43 protein [Paenibacillus kobensis]|uniref:glycoside hydrolase family 43 protein n=1 Tax=Paenibacillus kobensis TaxID=59841 RepID=UPI0027D83E48|nr:glycoside hydrolase family 43 protein [Paenibacillus kobensis]
MSRFRLMTAILVGTLVALFIMNRGSQPGTATTPTRTTQELTISMSEETNDQKAETANDQSASAIGKTPPNGNPLVSHKFGADPYALVYKDRVYLYATNDVLEYDGDGEVKDNTYSSINKLTVISSDDLVNWTDHGVVNAAGPQGAAKWATQSWAPAAAYKVIDGKDKFFLYFANNASGIGVLTSDSPTGPWVDPIGKPLVARSEPGVEGVTWLFDPAVLVDDDGKAYIYFGGGVPEGQYEMPNTARVMQLGDDMISVIGEAQVIPAPFMFEDAGINKVGDTYYFTYCSNFFDGARPEGSPPAGEIAYMTSSNPMGPWEYQGTILKNPGHFFGVGGNNHHAIFQFQDAWYIAYHAQTLSKAMGVPKGYRSTHLNQVSFNEDGSIQEITADFKGVDPVKTLDPYIRQSAETIAWSAGINVQPVQAGDAEYASSNMVVTDIDNADWTAVSNVNFGAGAKLFTASVSSVSEGSSIDLRLDSPDGQLIGTVTVPSASGDGEWADTSTSITGAEGIQHLYFVFKGKPGQKLFQFDSWQFVQ